EWGRGTGGQGSEPRGYGRWRRSRLDHPLRYGTGRTQRAVGIDGFQRDSLYAQDWVGSVERPRFFPDGSVAGTRSTAGQNGSPLDVVGDGDWTCDMGLASRLAEADAPRRRL